MNLKCRIKNKEFKIVQGVTFADEYSETLDSGSIIITDVEKLYDLKPYDDVFIWNADENFEGYDLKRELYLEFNIELTENGDYTIFKFQNDNLEKCLKEIPMISQNIIFHYSKIGVVSFNIFDIDESGFVLKTKNPEIPNIEFHWNGDGTASAEQKVPFEVQYISNCEILFFYANVSLPSFYKHMLVDQFSEDIIRFGTPDGNGNYIGTKYKYKIQLFSEAKRLETVQLPNISITQPLNIKKKKSVYDYLLMFNDMYSPLVKVVDNKSKKTWKYVKRYVIDPNLKEIFNDVYAPDFTLNNPNYRDLLAKLMLVKDCIPYVQNDVIKAMNITERKKDFDIDRRYITRVLGSRSSNDFCDNLKRTYSQALAQDESCRYVEHLGFRNSSAALMTLGNMQIETRYPIYKINKMYMCYYKRGEHKINRRLKEGDKCFVGDKVKISFDGKYFGIYSCIIEHDVPYIQDVNDYHLNEYWNGGWKNYFKEYNPKKIFLCKQDITPLIKLSSERNLLSQDWNEFKETFSGTIEDLSKYKMATVEYNIGSNIISGWGTKYTYPEGWWDINKSYIENIIKHLDTLYPFGISSLHEILNYESDKIIEESGEYFVIDDFMTAGIITPFVYDLGIIDDMINSLPFDEIAGKINATKLKSFFFEIDYNGFYNGSVIHSKDISDDDITINDNASESLTLLEQDGLFQKEKINRFGNKAIQIFGRYTHPNQLQELGSVYNYDGETDVIIYRKEYSIFDKEISCVYYGAKDYVMKNYFTTVFARHRTYNLMSYGESIRRAENRKMFLLISKDKTYFENENKKMLFENFNGNYLDKILSFYKSSPNAITKGVFITPEKINYGVLEHNGKYYASDINAFATGYSLCFNLSMYDNVSSGVYIKTANPFENRKDDWDVLINTEEDYTGSVQDWYMMVDDTETGFTKEIGFYVFHTDDEYGGLESSSIDDNEENEQKIYNIYKNKLLKLPYLDKLEDDISNKIGMKYEINKDNKEIIDMTFQIEPITNSEDIMFSQWLMKLSDLNGSYLKVQEKYSVNEKYVKMGNIIFEYGTFTRIDEISESLGLNPIKKFTQNPLIFVKINKDYFEKIKINEPLNVIIDYPYTMERYKDPTDHHYTAQKYKLTIKSISYKDENTIKFICDQYVCVYYAGGMGSHNPVFDGVMENIEMVFNRRITGTVDENEYQDKNKDYYEFVNFVQWTNNEDVSRFFELLPANMIRFTNIDGTTGYISTTYIPTEPGELGSGFAATENLKSSLISSQEKEDFIWYSNNNINIIPSRNIEEYDATSRNNEIFTYQPNIFIKLSPNKMKKTIVYDELPELKADKYGELISSKVEDYISIVDDKMIIQGLSEITQSVQVWYFDEKSQSYHFVFGVNKEPGTYSMELYISMLSTKNTKVYDENYKVIGHITNKGDGIQHYE